MPEAAPNQRVVVRLLSPISSRTRHAEYSWRSKDELISDVLPWTPTQGLVSVAGGHWMQPRGSTSSDDRDGLREGVRDFRAVSVI